MAEKKIKSHYLYPIKREKDALGREVLKLAKLDNVLSHLEGLDVKDRVYDLNEDGDNIQLKIIRKTNFDRWELCFLKNTQDSVFKTKITDETSNALELEDDEFIGQECCMIYDIKTCAVSLQSNIRSISFKYLATFFNSFINERIEFVPITLRPEYNTISDKDEIDYKSVSINFLDISEIYDLAKKEGNKSVEKLTEIAMNLGAINGKIELGVGRSKNNFLEKVNLKEVATFFKKYHRYSSGFKVKVLERKKSEEFTKDATQEDKEPKDSIRMIDLIQNKICSEFSISITRKDKKTFEKILNPMDAHFDCVIEKTLKDCISFTE